MVPVIPAGEAVIHIHEDDWGMRNLYPVAALKHVADDMGVADEHLTSMGGLEKLLVSEMHVIAEPPSSFKDFAIPIETMVTLLQPILPRVRYFYATASAGFEVFDSLGSYETAAWSFGYSQNCYIKIDVTDDIVSSIWFGFDTEVPEEIAALLAAFQAINTLIPCCIADYFCNEVFALSDAARLDAYFEAA